MTTELNDPQLGILPLKAPKRQWSTPIVIESDMSDTAQPNPQLPSPRDVITSGLRVGSGS